MPQDTILIVDDEPSMVELVKYNLEKEGYSIVTATDGREALEAFSQKPVSLVILDVMMPEMDGFSVCREIRKSSAVPIIMLTARSSETNKIVGLELGADDYVTKPFSVGELVARVKAVLRRSSASPASETAERDVIIRGDMRIDRKKRVVLVADVSVELTTREFDLLCLLAENPGIVFTRDQILDSVWGTEACVVDRAIDVHIRHLRQKLGDGSSDYISTVRGVGYRFEENF